MRNIFQTVNEVVSELSSTADRGDTGSSWMLKAGALATLVVTFVLFENYAVLFGTAALLIAAFFGLRHRETISHGFSASTNAFTVRNEIAHESDTVVTDETGAEILPFIRPFEDEWKDEQDFLISVLEMLEQRFHFQSGGIYILSEDKSHLVQRATLSRTQAITRLATVAFGHGLVGWVAARKRPLIVSNLHHDGRSVGYYRSTGEKVGSFAAVPLIADGNVLGVLALDHEETGAFPERETEETLFSAAAVITRLLGYQTIHEEKENSFTVNVRAGEVLNAMYDAAGLDEAAQELVSGLSRQSEFFGVGCYLVDENGEPVRRAGVGFRGIAGNTCKETVYNDAAAQSLSRGAPYHLEKSALEAQYRRTGAPQELMGRYLVSYPLFHKGDSVGAVVLETLERIDGEQIEEVVGSIAASAGTAFVRIYRADEQALTETTEISIGRFTSRLLELHTLDELWEALENFVSERSPSISLLAYEKEGDSYRLLRSRKIEASEVLPAKGSLLGWAALAGRPVITSKRDRLEPPSRDGESFLFAPMAGHEPNGMVLVAVSSERNAFSGADTQWFSILSKYLSPLLRNVLRSGANAEAAERDHWTGLYNERGMTRRACALASTGDTNALLLRIDNYDVLLDSAGRTELKSSIRKLANVLANAAGSNVLVGRIDGDRFYFVSHDDLSMLKKRLADKLRSSSLSMIRESSVFYSLSWAGTSEGVRPEDLLEVLEGRMSSARNRIAAVADVA